jgi:acyl dehydratase
VHDLPSVGETVTVGGSVVDLFERNGSKYITFRTEIAGADGRALATVDHTSIYALARR